MLYRNYLIFIVLLLIGSSSRAEKVQTNDYNLTVHLRFDLKDKVTVCPSYVKIRVVGVVIFGNF